MQKQPNNWGAVASAPYFSEYKFVIAGEEYTKAELQGTPVIEKPLMKTPTIGKCCSGMLQICIRGASIPKAAPVIAYSRIVSKTTGTASDWIEQGHYFVSSRVKKSNCVQFTCRDLMLKANAEYYERSAIEDWPATMADVVNEISTIMGVPLDERTFIRTGEDYVVSCPDADVLMTEVLGDIAAAHMGTWIITECGKLRLVPFTGASVPVSDIGAAHGKISFLSSEYTVTGISLSDDADNTFFSGNKDGYVLSAVCHNAEQKITDDNAELISNGISFLPYSMNDAYISPLTELGDTILVSDKDGNHYPLVVTYMKIVCGMAFVASLSLSVDDTDEDEFPYVDSSMLEKRRTITTGKAYFGNTISRNNGFVSELLIDKQPTARLIANAGKFAMQQFANGEWTDRVYFDPEKGKYHISGEVIVDGTLTIGVLSEKADKTFINGGNIITGTLSASVISSGVLKSQNESLVFDLDNNLLTVGGEDIKAAVDLTATKIGWMVKSGTSESNFTMTDRAMELATSNLNLQTADIYEYDSTPFDKWTVSGASDFSEADIDGVKWWVSTNHDDQSCSVCKFSVTMPKDGEIYFQALCEAENNGAYRWDYGIVGKLDKTLSTSWDESDGENVQQEIFNTESPVDVVIPASAGTHYFYVKYRKDGSVSNPPDTLRITHPKVRYLLAGTALTIRSGETVLSSTNVIVRGVVTMTDLLESGSTVINGDNITTGTIRGATLLTEKKLGTLSGYDYYGVTEVTGGGVQFYAEKRSDGSVVNTNYVAEFSPNYEDDTYSACLIRLDAKGKNGVAITSPQNCITLQSPEIWLAPCEDWGNANISINAGYGGVYVSATNLRFNTNADPNTGCGTAGQVLKSGGKNDGCYWGDGLLFDLLWSNSTGVYSGEYYYSKDASNYKALLFVGKPSGGSRNSVLVPIEEANGNKFEIGDNSGFINFNVRTYSFTASQRAGGGVLNAVYGIK